MSFQPKLSRCFAAAALIAGMLLNLPGCGDSKPASENKDKKADAGTNGSPPLNINSGTPNNSTDPGTKVQPTPPAVVTHVDLNVGVGKDATDFLTSLKNGYVRPDQLSNGFVRAIGLPVVFPTDKAKGYSADNAEALLKNTLSMHGLGLLAISKQVGDVALFRGPLIPAGEISLRMVHEGGAWKVDWLSLSSVAVQGGTLNTSAPETVCQEFAIAAVIGLLVDKDALSKETRAVLLAAGLTPALKKKWADPLDSDKAEGYDYNRGLMAKKAVDFGAGVESFSFAQVPNTPDFRVELNRAAGAKSAYLVKLVKGTSPGQWLVDDVIPQ